MVDATVNRGPDVLGTGHSAKPATRQAEPSRLTEDLARRLYSDFGANTTYTDVITVVERCRRDLDASPASVPEFLERLARQRLAARFGDPSSGLE
jgi:hypothetical protein